MWCAWCAKKPRYTSVSSFWVFSCYCSFPIEHTKALLGLNDEPLLVLPAFQLLILNSLQMGTSSQSDKLVTRATQTAGETFLREVVSFPSSTSHPNGSNRLVLQEKHDFNTLGRCDLMCSFLQQSPIMICSLASLSDYFILSRGNTSSTAAWTFFLQWKVLSMTRKKARLNTLFPPSS